MTPLWGPAPPGWASNSYFDAVNADSARRSSSASRRQHLRRQAGPILAARDVPDMFCPELGDRPAGPLHHAADKLFEDLTPYLEGDKVKAYPMLANLPTGAWA